MGKRKQTAEMMEKGGGSKREKNEKICLIQTNMTIQQTDAGTNRGGGD